MLYRKLNPDKALIWRIVHAANLPWLLGHGLHCANSPVRSPDYVSIGSAELIDKRRHRPVPLPPGGTLADYVPFYFTPFSVMMKNIHTGWGVPQQRNEDIVILVSSLHHVHGLGIPLVYTDAHAYPSWSNYYSDLADLGAIDWALLQRRDFKRDADDPRKMERYQAEALIYRHLPVTGLLGIICYTEAVQSRIALEVQAKQLKLPVHLRTDWYF